MYSKTTKEMCNNIDDTFNLFVTEKTKINSDAKVKLIECNDNKDELKNTLNILRVGADTKWRFG